MQWFLVKLVFRIVCGNGQHTPQFDEQLRLVQATDEGEALEKGRSIGCQEGESFFNNNAQLVQWQFIDVAELYSLGDIADGAELYSSIREVDDADLHMQFVSNKARSLRMQFHAPAFKTV